MGNSKCLLALIICMVGMGFAGAVEPIKVQQLACDGGPLWLWVQGADATCENIGNGVFVCQDVDDYSRGACSTGCQEIRLGSIAGCYRGNQPPIAGTNFTKQCANGKVYDITGVSGDTCYDVNDASMPDGGAECSQEVGGETVVSSRVSCKDGCVLTRPPADCRLR